MTVFWPIDVGHSGFCYGWQGPVICIAGVLKTDSVSNVQKILFFCLNVRQESQAEALLRRANDSKQWLPYKNSCGGRDVVLMGKDRPGHNNNIIYYHRHPLNSMRFYSLGMDDAVIQNARHSGLDANVINQVSSCSVNPRIRTNRLRGFSSTRLKC